MEEMPSFLSFPFFHSSTLPAYRVDSKDKL